MYALLALHRAEPLGIHARRPCRAECGATAPSPSKNACSQPHKATMQGRIMTAAQSRYARMHKDSHTKPLHDATAQMAVNAQMQWHKWLTTCTGAPPKARMLWLLAKSFARCKTSRASNARRPFFIAKSFFDRLIIYLLYNGIVWGIA